MFNPFRKLFGKREEAKAEAAAPAPDYNAYAPAQPYYPPAQPAARAEAQPRPVQAATGAPGEMLSLPLRSVIARLPKDLAARVRQSDVGEAEVFIAMSKVLSQLPQGAVKISFGELRQAAPPGTFSPENDRDRVLVDLPLHEILMRVNATSLPRRQSQRQVEVPAEVAGPFGGKTRVTISKEPVKGGAVAAKPAPAPSSIPAPAAVPAFQRAPAAAPTSIPGPRPVPVAASGADAEEPIFKRANAPAAAPAPIQMPSTIPAPAAKAPTPAYPGGPVFNRPNVPPAQPRPQVVPQETVFRRAPAAPAQPIPTARPVAQPQPAADADEPIFKRATPAPAAPAAHGPAPVKPVAAPVQRQAQTPQPSLPDDQPIFRRAGAPATPPAQPVAPQTPAAKAGPIPFSPAKPAAPIPFGEAKPAAPKSPAPAPAAPAAKSDDAPLIRFNPAGATPPAPAAPVRPAAPAAPAARPAVPAAPIAPPPAARPAAPVAQPAGAGAVITVSLAELSEAWPDAVRQEISALGLSGASVALPKSQVETAMKQGRIAYPWHQVRAWIKPAAPPSHASANDAEVLELPLKVVTPAFMTSLRGGKSQKKVSIDVNIPNLFAGSDAELTAASPVVTPPPPPPATNPATGSTDTNYYVRQEPEKAETPAPEEKVVIKKGPSPGTSFLQRYATPNEIVSKAAALNGVGGALIALPDGLLVASKIPSEMNADTLAAFLPQIFSRVSQSTRELRMGDLNNLNFTVGPIPWKIFRVGAIYFAAFGIAGQPLPTAQLAGIAAELDRKAK